MKILLVEDDGIAGMMGRTTLERLDCQVKIARSGKEALENIFLNTYDLVFLDIGLPDIKGFEVAKEVRKKDKYKNLPLIALTAHDKEKVKKQCAESGVNDYLIKPLTQEKCEAIFNKFFHKG